MHSLDNILTELIFILLHFLLFVVNYQIMKKRIMHPAVLFSLLWFIILLLHFSFSFTLLDELFPISISTYLIFFIGVLSFSFGSFIQTVIRQKKESSKNQIKVIADISENKISLTLRFILLAIIIIGLPFYIQAAYRVFIASNLDNFFVGLRTELSYGDEDIGPLKYLVSFSFTVFALNLYVFFKEKNKINTILLIVNFLITLTYAIFTTGRGLFFMSLTLYIGMAYLFDTSFSIKKILRLMVVFLILFMGIGILYGKGGDTESSASENIKPAAQTTALYLVTSLDALDLETSHQLKINYAGNNSLRFFTKIGEQLNLIPNLKASELVQEFVFVPYPTNVYTFYSPYIKDFGKFYAWFMIALFGFLHTFLYNKALATKNIRYSLYYSFMLFPLLMSFFQDQYLSLFSTWLQIVVYIEGFIVLNKFFISKKW